MNKIVQELLEADPTVPMWPTAGQALGMSRTTAFKLAKEGEFPVRLLRLGSAIRVPTADLLKLLGIERPSSGGDGCGWKATALEERRTADEYRDHAAAMVKRAENAEATIARVKAEIEQRYMDGALRDFLRAVLEGE